MRVRARACVRVFMRAGWRVGEPRCCCRASRRFYAVLKSRAAGRTLDLRDAARQVVALNMRLHGTCRKAKNGTNRRNAWPCNKQCDPTDPRYVRYNHTPHQSLAVVRLIQDAGRTEHTCTARPAPASPQSDIPNSSRIESRGVDGKPVLLPCICPKQLPGTACYGRGRIAMR